MVKKKLFIRQKVGKCPFCEGKCKPDWKNPEGLSKSLSERGKILSKLKIGTCAKHQRQMCRAVKRARYIGLLPFVTRV